MGCCKERGADAAHYVTRTLTAVVRPPLLRCRRLVICTGAEQSPPAAAAPEAPPAELPGSGRSGASLRVPSEEIQPSESEEAVVPGAEAPGFHTTLRLSGSGRSGRDWGHLTPTGERGGAGAPAAALPLPPP